MRRKLSDALNEISDTHIVEAANAKPRKKPYWLGAVAAVLAIVLLFRLGGLPIAVRANAVSLVPEQRTEERPERDDYETWEEWRLVLDAWDARQSAREDTVQQAAIHLTPFFQEGSRLILNDSGSKNNQRNQRNHKNGK